MHHAWVMWGLPSTLRILVLCVMLLGNGMLRRMMTRLALQSSIKAILWQMHIELVGRVRRR